MAAHHPHSPDAPDEHAIRRQLEKILSSSPFAGSARMSRFLRFAVEQSLAGHAGELKEYLLGVEIFDRRSSFDPRVDPIVRVEARRLRSKLKSYYEQHGRDDRLLIELPTGTYAPRIRWRDSDYPAGPPPPAPAGNIAVLPFANLSPEPDREYFSDGLTEELIHALTKVEGLRVVAWSSSAKMKDRQYDFAEIGQELKVAAVLVGSVRQAGGRVRVMARLVDTASGQYLWSEIYDRQLEDLFGIQEDISRAIVRSLKSRLLHLGAAPARPPARNLDAYDLYLRGRFHWNQRTPEGLQHSAQLFEQALSLDPEFAPAHVGLADALSLQADYGLVLPGDVMPRAKAAALRALELDPTLAEAHASLAFICSLYEWCWDEAGQYYRRAIELNPSYVTAHYWYGCDYLALLGRFDEALAELEIAVRLDPLSHLTNETVGYVLMLARRFDEALQRQQAARELDPHFYRTYTDMGRVCLHKGMYSEAVEMFEKGRALAGDIPSMLGALGQAYALAGRQAEARAALERLSEMAHQRYVPSTAYAFIHSALGEKERALDWLEFACERRELPLTNLKVHPGYDALRAEPRFQSVLARLGLA